MDVKCLLFFMIFSGTQLCGQSNDRTDRSSFLVACKTVGLLAVVKVGSDLEVVEKFLGVDSLPFQGSHESRGSRTAYYRLLGTIWLSIDSEFDPRSGKYTFRSGATSNSSRWPSGR